MTVQKANAITFDEILALQFECKECKVRVSIPISSPSRMLYECPFCHDSWVVNKRSDLHEAFFTAVNQTAMLMKQVADGTNNVKCVVSLVVKPEIQPASESES
jgi:uncharacterized paraquat-inducible protein A